MARPTVSLMATVALAVISVSAVPTGFLQSSNLERTSGGVRDTFGRQYEDYRLSSGQAHPKSTHVSQRDEPRIRSPTDPTPYVDSLTDEQSGHPVALVQKHASPESLQQPISFDEAAALCFHIIGYSSAAPHINNRHLRLTVGSTPSFRVPRHDDAPATTFHLSHDGILSALPSGDVLVAPAHPSGGEWASFIPREVAEKDPQWYRLAVCKADARKHRLECSHPSRGVKSDDVDLEPLTLSVLRTDYCSFSGENGLVQDDKGANMWDVSYGNGCGVAWWPMWGVPGGEEDADFRTIALGMEETKCP